MVQDADSAIAARAEGRREGFALAALALSFASFVNLLGAEKSLLAIALAVAAGGSLTQRVRRRSQIAIGLAALHLLTLAVVLIMFRQQFGEFLGLLHKLG